MTTHAPKRAPRRPNVIFELGVGKQDFYVGIGLGADKRPIEIFIDLAKEGSTARCLYAQLGRVASSNWQRGEPISEIISKWKDDHFEPEGYGRGHIAIEGLWCKSVLDAIARVLEAEYVEGTA